MSEPQSRRRDTQYGPTSPLRSNDVRERNEKLVLRLIQDRGFISQSEVAQETGLRPPTVFRIFSTLEEQELILPSPKRVAESEGRGRRPSLYRVNSSAGYAIGVDLWAGSVAATVVDFSRTTVVNRLETFDSEGTVDSVLTQVTTLISELISQAEIPHDRVLGIGIAAPGVVDITQGSVVSYERIAGMSGTGIVEALSEHFSLPVLVHNNSSVIALSEYRYGAVQGASSVLAVVIRTGVGGAFLQHGVPFTNGGITALEVGHLIVDPSGGTRKQPATLESILNEDALFSRISRVCDTQDRTEMLKCIEERFSSVIEALETPIEALSSAIVSLTNLFNPEEFLIVTRHAELSRFLASEAHERASHFTTSTRLRPGPILAAEYDALLACRGASDLVFDQFFTVSGN